MVFDWVVLCAGSRVEVAGWIVFEMFVCWK